jgi:DNA-binding CsgD family transcriptional regulator
MNISISSALSSASLGAESAFSTSNSPPKTQPVPNDVPYTVQLTAAQRVYNLYNQGNTVSQIASSLDLSVELVNSFLNISNNKS